MMPLHPFCNYFSSLETKNVNMTDKKKYNDNLSKYLVEYKF